MISPSDRPQSGISWYDAHEVVTAVEQRYHVDITITLAQAGWRTARGGSPWSVSARATGRMGGTSGQYRAIADRTFGARSNGPATVTGAVVAVAYAIEATLAAQEARASQEDQGRLL